MNPNESIVNTKKIQDKIFTIRGLQVIIDSDLAEMYQVPTGRINEQVKRNKERYQVGVDVEHFLLCLQSKEFHPYLVF